MYWNRNRLSIASHVQYRLLSKYSVSIARHMNEWLNEEIHLGLSVVNYEKMVHALYIWLQKLKYKLIGLVGKQKFYFSFFSKQCSFSLHPHSYTCYHLGINLHSSSSAWECKPCGLVRATVIRKMTVVFLHIWVTWPACQSHKANLGVSKHLCFCHLH